MARKKKNQKMIAVVDPATCTGCEACLSICPTQCINSVDGARSGVTPKVCSVDVPRCVGCTLCDQVCPWDCISMVATEEFLQKQAKARDTSE